MTAQEQDQQNLAAALQGDAAINPQPFNNAFTRAIEEAKEDGHEFV